MEKQAKDGTFYRKVGADDWEEVRRTSKDGTVYKKVGADEWQTIGRAGHTIEDAKVKGPEPGFLDADGPVVAGIYGAANGATLGYMPQIQGLADKALYPAMNKMLGEDIEPGSYLESRDRALRFHNNLAEKNPVTYTGGNILGGIGAAIATPGLGAAKGATALARMKSAGGVGAAFGAAMNPGDVEGEISPVQLKGRALNSLLGGAMGAGFQGVGEGYTVARNLKNKGMKMFGEFIEDSKPKNNAHEIIAAGEALGVNPTPGMLNENAVIQGLESSLEQAPTIAGAHVRRQVNKVRDGLKGHVEGLLEEGANTTSFGTGEKIKQLILKDTGEKVSPATWMMDDLVSSYGHMPVNDRGVKAVARNLRKIREVDLLPSQGFSKKINRLADDMLNLETFSDVRTVRQSVGRELSKARAMGDVNLDRTLSAAYKKLTHLEQRTLQRGIIDSMKGINIPKGRPRALEALRSLREANKMYAGAMDDMGSFSKMAKLKKPSNPEAFVGNVEGAQSELLFKKLADVGNMRTLRGLRDDFPDIFEAVRKGKVGEYLKKAEYGETVSLKKFINTIKNVDDEALDIVFGGDHGLSELKTLVDAFPPMMGPSGTPQGLDYSATWSPIKQGMDFVRLGQYKALQDPRAQALARKIRARIKAKDLPTNTKPNQEKLYKFLRGSQEAVARDNVLKPSFGQSPYRPSVGGKVSASDEKPDFTKEKVSEEDARNQYLEGN